MWVSPLTLIPHVGYTPETDELRSPLWATERNRYRGSRATRGEHLADEGRVTARKVLLDDRGSRGDDGERQSADNDCGQDDLQHCMRTSDSNACGTKAQIDIRLDARVPIFGGNVNTTWK
jgi:hypothetical protein